MTELEGKAKDRVEIFKNKIQLCFLISIKHYIHINLTSSTFEPHRLFYKCLYIIIEMFCFYTHLFNSTLDFKNNGV